MPLKTVKKVMEVNSVEFHVQYELDYEDVSEESIGFEDINITSVKFNGREIFLFCEAMGVLEQIKNIILQP